MGFISDFLGGKKPPPPPASLGRNAETGERLAGGSVKLWEMLEPSLAEFANVWGDEQDKVQADALAARDLADERVGDYDELWGGPEGFMGLAQRTAREASEAGSMARQAREQARAEKEALEGAGKGLMRRREEAFRRGISLTDDGGVMEAISGGLAGAAGTAARLRERDYGEGLRRGMLPVALNVGGMAPGYAGQRLGFADAAAKTRMAIPGGISQVFMGGQQVNDNAMTGIDSSNALALTKYDADLRHHEATEARRKGIWDTGFKLAMLAAAPFTGGASLAAVGASPFGSGGGGGGGFSMSAAHNMAMGNRTGGMAPVTDLNDWRQNPHTR